MYDNMSTEELERRVTAMKWLDDNESTEQQEISTDELERRVSALKWLDENDSDPLDPTEEKERRIAAIQREEELTSTQ